MSEAERQSAAGLVPEGWDLVPFSQFVSIQRGHDLTARQRRNGSVPVMGSAGLNGFHDTAIQAGPGMVLGRSGASYGQAHWCEADFWPHNTALYVTDFLGNDPRFVYYLLRATDFSQHNSGGAQQSLNRNFIAGMLLARPPRPEQELIRRCLDDAEALVTGLERVIAKKRLIKQGAMQDLLTARRRLPGFSGEWEVKRLIELAGIDKGLQLHSSQIGPSGDIPHYNGGVTPSGFAQEANRPAGTIIISEGGNSCGYVQLTDKPFWCGGHCYAISERAIDKMFLFQALKNRQTEIMALRVGSGLPNIQKTSLAGFSLMMPRDPTEQQAIATVLSDMDAEIQTLESRLTKARAVKEGMMQNLLTGRVRLV